MNRYDIINSLITKFGYTRYLEVGMEHAVHCFDNVHCAFKESIDPVNYGVPPTHLMTSDEYFSKHTDKFDIIFIDGLHTCEQVLRDVHNSLPCLTPNGTLVLHDCNPPEVYYQDDPPQRCGDVWKAIARLRCFRSDLEMCVVDTDYGCGLIRFGKQELYHMTERDYTWDYFSKYKREMLNLISVDDFIKKYGGV